MDPERPGRQAGLHLAAALLHPAAPPLYLMGKARRVQHRWVVGQVWVADAAQVAITAA